MSELIRIEYMRRYIANSLGILMEKGNIPFDFDLVGNMIKNIAYENTMTFFDLMKENIIDSEDFENVKYPQKNRFVKILKSK